MHLNVALLRASKSKYFQLPKLGTAKTPKKKYEEEQLNTTKKIPQEVISEVIVQETSHMDMSSIH